jgi:hypothetical protein
MKWRKSREVVSCWTQCLRHVSGMLVPELPAENGDEQEASAIAWFLAHGSDLRKTECPVWPTTDWPCVVCGYRGQEGHAVVAVKGKVVLDPAGRRQRPAPPWACYQWWSPEQLRVEREQAEREALFLAEDRERLKREQEWRREELDREFAEMAEFAQWNSEHPTASGDVVDLTAASERALFGKDVKLGRSAIAYAAYTVPLGLRRKWTVVACGCLFCRRGTHVAVDEPRYYPTDDDESPWLHFYVGNIRRMTPNNGWKRPPVPNARNQKLST